MQYELTKAKKYNRINIKGDTTVNKIKVSTKSQKAKSTYATAKATHNREIKAIRKLIKAKRRDIKMHKLLKKQARTLYKMSGLEK